MGKETERTQSKRQRTGDRRLKEDRRLDGERRVVDVGSPERRLSVERRQVEMGPPERRDRHDRRETEDGPPPGWKDRRRHAERRIPAVAEVPFEMWEKERSERANALSRDDSPPETPVAKGRRRSGD